jgi:hypothetical protein
MSAARSLQNRLLIATQLWRESSRDPLPKLPPGDPADQISELEIRLVDMLGAAATPDTARDVADKTWDLVHDRADDDPVKRRVTELHEQLARLSAGRSGA